MRDQLRCSGATLLYVSIHGKGGGNGYYLFSFTFVLKRRSLPRPIGNDYGYREEVYAEEVLSANLQDNTVLNSIREREELVSL